MRSLFHIGRSGGGFGNPLAGPAPPARQRGRVAGSRGRSLGLLLGIGTFPDAHAPGGRAPRRLAARVAVGATADTALAALDTGEAEGDVVLQIESLRRLAQVHRDGGEFGEAVARLERHTTGQATRT